jgi:hypothetical protein
VVRKARATVRTERPTSLQVPARRSGGWQVRSFLPALQLVPVAEGTRDEVTAREWSPVTWRGRWCGERRK